jgi:hypothetical protein
MCRSQRLPDPDPPYLRASHDLLAAASGASEWSSCRAWCLPSPARQVTLLGWVWLRERETARARESANGTPGPSRMGWPIARAWPVMAATTARYIGLRTYPDRRTHSRRDYCAIADSGRTPEPEAGRE